MKAQYSFLPALAVILLFASPLAPAKEDAQARPSPDREAKPARACEEDMRRLCPDMKPGDGKLAACMRENQDRLSAACKSEQERMREKAGERREHARQACEGDVQRFCKGVEAGGGRVLRCLKEHKTELSEACRATMERKPPRDGEPKRDRRGEDRGKE